MPAGPHPTGMLVLPWPILVIIILFICLYTVQAAPSPYSLQDAYALKSFQSQIWSDPYNSLSDWIPDPTVGHACFWNGVKCADLSAYRVSSLQLTGVGLSGIISSNLGGLTELTTLNLSWNSLTGDIPSQLSQCTKLTLLDLSHNTLSAVVPTQIGNLLSLRKLYLGYNQLVGTVLFLSSMINLIELSLESNGFNGYPFTIIAGLTNLVYLNLGQNMFAGALSANDFAPFGSLTHMLVGSNMLQGQLPSSVVNLTSLQRLDMGKNNLTGYVPAGLQSSSGLVYLNVSYNQLNGSLPGLINKLPLLSVLDLSRNQMVGNVDPVIGCMALTDLRLSDNQLNGSIPRGFGGFTNLNYLDLSGNMLTGSIPVALAALSLKVFDLSSNQLTGGLVDFATSSVLVQLDFSNNSLSGQIPTGYSKLQYLQFLSLASNQLTGEIPVDLGKSPRLKTVLLGGNSLTGRIPLTLAYANLQVFNVSNNYLRGEIPYTPVMQRFPANSFLPGNPELCGAIIRRSCPKTGFPSWGKGILASFVPVIGAALAVLLFNWLFPRGGYSPKAVRKMTDDFNNTNLIGVGGTSTVYRGVLPDGKEVAVKRFRPENTTGELKNFQLERNILLDVKHPNIVRVYGSCSGDGLKALILEPMNNGNLDMHLHQGEPSNLSWSTRMDIAAGVAQGVAYLHGEWQSLNRGPLHCDLKASSVLLDNKFNAKITDIHLPASTDSFLKEPFSVYTPPEYELSPAPTTSGDVYSLGTLMLELVTGVKPDGSLEKGLRSRVRAAFPDKLGSVINMELIDGPFYDQVAIFTKIALHCTKDSPQDRPNMQEVLQMFRQAYAAEPR